MAIIAIASDPVPLRGEALGEIWWRGRQWAVTSDGIERLDGTYVIERSRLVEYPEESWPEHMAGKIWVDVPEFTTAWLVALLLHGAPSPAPSALFAIFARLEAATAVCRAGLT